MLFTTLSLAAALAGPLPTALPTATINPAVIPADLEWFDGPFTNAVGKARHADTSVVVYFWSDQSESCGKMYTDTIQNQRSKDVLKKNVLVSANYNTDEGAKLFKRFNVSVLPTMLVVNGEGIPEDAVVGLIGVDDLLVEFARIESGEGTVSGLKAQIAAAKHGSEEIIECSWKLAGKLSDLGQQESHDAMLVSIKANDPKARTVIGARAQLWLIRDEIFANNSGKDEECTCEGEGGEKAEGDGGKGETADGDGECAEGECAAHNAFASADLSPLYTYAKKVRAEESRFEVWQTIGNMEGRRADTAAAVKAYKNAFKVVPDVQCANFTQSVVNWIVNSDEQEHHNAKVRKFALQLAEKGVKRARLVDPMSDSYKLFYGQTEPHLIEASSMAALAFTYDLNGDAKKAHNTAAKVIELTKSDDYRKYLAPLLTDM